MVLDNRTVEKIKAFVYQKPRSINEVAMHIGKNWRTADRYLDQIMQQTGQLKTTVFREGTRGALKLVYWNNTEKIYSTDVQQDLFKKIESGIHKSDFSPFEIYQYVDSDKRYGYYEVIDSEEDYKYDIKTLYPFFESAEKEILIFAGNLAFIHLKYNGKTMLELLEDCVKRKVCVRIITNINMSDLANVEKVVGLNIGLKEPFIQVKHFVCPLRAYIFDNTIIKLGDILHSAKKKGQTKGIIATYYEIRDEIWIEWMQKMFFQEYQKSIPANIRIDNLNSLKKFR